MNNYTKDYTDSATNTNSYTHSTLPDFSIFQFQEDVQIARYLNIQQRFVGMNVSSTAGTQKGLYF